MKPKEKKKNVVYKGKIITKTFKIQNQICIINDTIKLYFKICYGGHYLFR